MAAGLQRSSVSFRRQGSSGLVWEDRFLAGDPRRPKEEGEETAERELRPSRSTGGIGMLERSRSGGGGKGWRTGKVSPAIDPPSPKVSGCGFCGVFGKPTNTQQPKSRRR